MRKRTPLPPDARDKLRALQLALKEADSGLSRKQAITELESEGFVSNEIPGCLDILVERGYLYTVEGKLFLTYP
jgi:hypothetical protein